MMTPKDTELSYTDNLTSAKLFGVTCRTPNKQ